MLKRIVTNSVELVKFITCLGLKVSLPQRKHITNLVDALIVSEERKTVAGLNRQLVGAKDDSSVVHSLRDSPWQAEEIRSKVLRFMVRTALEVTCRLGLEKVISLSLDDALCEKDKDTRHLESVDWHHDHNASRKKQQAYKNGSVYVVCHLKVGFISFAINWRLYLREKTVRRLNRHRPKEKRLKFRSKYRLARAILAEIVPLIPDDFQVYVLFDSWYASAKLIKYCRRQGWQVICGLRSNRTLNGLKLNQWHKQLRHKRYERVLLTAADNTQQTYFVRSLQGRLSEVPFTVRVFISKRHPRSLAPAYFLCTDLALSAQESLVQYADRWWTEVDNFYLKTRFGIADYQLQSFEAIEKFHALVFLALAYVQYRLVQSQATQHQLPYSPYQPHTWADIIRLHRAEHEGQLLKAVYQLARQRTPLCAVLDTFLRPFSPSTPVSEVLF